MANVKYLDLTGLQHYDEKIKKYIPTATSTDESIGITLTTDQTTGLRNYDFSVNIDGTTITLNANGELQVVSSALTEYVGDDKAIEVSSESAGEKTISLKLKSGEEILNADSNGLSSKIYVKKLTSSEIANISGLTANSGDVYALYNKNDQMLTGSAPIVVPKDTSLLSVELLHATSTATPTYTQSSGTWTDIASALQTPENVALCFAYLLADGSVNVQAVRVGDFLQESEFKDGLQVNNGEVSIKIDPTSDSALSVSPTGLKVTLPTVVHTTLTEVAADATIPSPAGNPKIIVTKSTAEDGHSNYTITGQDLASATRLTNAETTFGNNIGLIVNAAGLTLNVSTGDISYSNSGTNILGTSIKGDISALDTAIQAVAGNIPTVSDSAVTGQVATAISNNSGTISTIKENLTSITLTAYTKGSTAGNIVTSDTLGNAFSRVENRLDALETAMPTLTAITNSEIDGLFS